MSKLKKKEEGAKEIIKLNARIKIAQKCMLELIAEANRLNEVYENKRVSYYEYAHHYDKLKDRMNDYSRYTSDYRRKIAELKSTEKTILPYAFVILAVIIGIFFVFNSLEGRITGFAVFGQEGVTREINCDGCSGYNVPANAVVLMKLNVSSAGKLAEYYPSSWDVINTNGGIVSVHDYEYYKIEWELAEAGGISYSIKSPENAGGSYTFRAEFLNESLNEVTLELFAEAGAGYSLPVEENITIPEEGIAIPPEENITVPPEENITIPPETPETNISLPEENITIPPEENITLPPEINYTIPAPPEENVTLPEKNLTKATLPKTNYSIPPEPKSEPPVLIKLIPNITIRYNKSYSLNLSEYFSDPENKTLAYYSNTIAHLVISIENDSAVITPDIGFSGTETAQFFASDNESMTESNEFEIEVLSEAGFGVFSASMHCYITAPGDCEGTIFLYMENSTGGYENAHAQNVSAATYAYAVCCNVSGDTLTTSCEDETFLRLSGTSNAHVQQNNYDTYSVDACMSSTNGIINCTYGTCGANQTCLLSISADTNAHVGSCSHYATNVCCGYIASAPLMNASPIITPDPAYTNDTLVCSASTYDVNTDNITINFTWYNGSIYYSSENNYSINGSIALSILSPAQIQNKNETWNCSVRSFDGANYSVWQSANITIQNLPPTTPTLDQPPDNYNISDTTPFFNWTASTDVDEDSITYEIQIANDTAFNNPQNITQLNEASDTNYTATAMTEGVYYWRVKAITDDANSSYTNYRTFTIGTTVPTFTNAVNTSTDFKRYSNFTANITITNGIVGLDAYKFSTNVSGSWVNTTVDISGSPYNASNSRNITQPQGSSICWYYWANDSAGNTNSSDTYCFTAVNTVPTHSNPFIGAHVPYGTTATIDDNITGYWQFEGDAVDVTGVNNGTVYGANLTDVGRVGRAYSFNGSGAYINLAGNVVMNNISSAISLWFKTDFGSSSSTSGIMVGKNNDNDAYIYAFNPTTIRVQSDQVSTVKSYTVPTINSGQWYHLAVIRDSGSTSVYINGQQSSSGPQVIPYDLTITEIGKYSTGAAGFWYSGSLDEVIIYNRSLSASEISETYNKTAGTYNVYTTEDLGCSANNTADVDGNGLKNIFNWYKNNVSIMIVNMPFETNDGSAVWASGKVGNALYFDGINDMVDAYTWLPIAYVGQNVTWSFWAKQNKNITNQMIFGCSGGGGYTYPVYFGSNGNITGRLSNNAPEYTLDSGGVDKSNWHHYALTAIPYNSTHGNVSLYVDGVIRSGNNYTRMDSNGQYNRIGSHGTGNYFNGTLDEIMIFGRALSDNEILSIYNNQSIGLNALTSDASLKNYYSLNETSGFSAMNTKGFGANVYNYDRAKDYSGFGKNGTVWGATWNSTGGYDRKGAYEFRSHSTSNNVTYIFISQVFPVNTYRWTASAWVYPHALYSSGNQFLSELNHAPLIVLSTDYGVSIWSISAWRTCGAGNISLNKWNHIVVAANTNGSYNNWTDLYINGVKMGCSSINGWNVSFPFSTSNFYIGSRDGDYLDTTGLDGFMDEVRIYNYSLSAAQVLAIYQNKTNTIVAEETTKGDNWTCSVTPNDGSGDGTTLNSSVLTILNLAPVAALISPAQNETTVNRTIAFNWTVSDADGDSVTSDILIDDNSDFSSALVNVSGLTDTNYTYGILDVDTTYFWKVRANDSEGYGSWTSTWNFTVESYISISLINDVVNFGSMANNETKNTTTNNPAPFLLENAGNVFANITVNGSQLFTSVGFPSEYYQYEIGVNESYSFDNTTSTMNWRNMTDVDVQTDIYNLNWSDLTDNAEVELLIWVPPTEGGGTRNSTVIFTAS